jgi:Zn-dependent protease with chaperone function
MTFFAPQPHLAPPGIAPSPAELPLAALPLLLALAVPLGIAAWLRLRALRAIAQHPDTAWFAFARAAQWVILGGWLAWFAALSPSPLVRMGLPFLSPLGLPWAVAIVCVVCALPPALLSLAIQALVHDVRRRAGATQLTLGEAMRVASWQMAAGLIPIGLVVLGAAAWVWRHAGLGVASLALALVARLWLLRRALAALGTIPQAVTSGPLRDRIFELAARADVSLKQLYVMPMARLQGANAFAVSNGTVMLTDVLLEQLSEREVVAVMAHEVAHLKHKHPIRIARTGLFALIFPLILLQWLALLRWLPSILAVAVPVLSSLLATLVVRRRYEYQADATAIELCRDPEALITGLVRISALNHVPLHWGPWAERSLTHPSTRRRLARIAELANLAPERLEQLLQSPQTARQHFEFPRALASGRLFSSSWKMRVSANLGLFLIALQTGLPALVVRSARGLAPPFGSHLSATVLATLVTSLALMLAVNWLSVAPSRGLERRMLARLAERGIRAHEHHAIFVGLSPTREPRLYEQSGDWDLGFLIPRGDRLCYFGEEASFALERRQVEGVQLGPGLPNWIPAPRVIVSWRDGAGESREFSLRPARVSSLAATGAASRRLNAELKDWLRGAPVSEGAALMPPGDPPTGQVTSISPRELVGPKTLPRALVLVLIFTGAIGAALALPLGITSPGMLDALVAAALAVVIQRVPYWMPGERRPTTAGRGGLDRAA